MQAAYNRGEQFRRSYISYTQGVSQKFISGVFYPFFLSFSPPFPFDEKRPLKFSWERCNLAPWRAERSADRKQIVGVFRAGED